MGEPKELSRAACEPTRGVALPAGTARLCVPRRAEACRAESPRFRMTGGPTGSRAWGSTWAG